MQLTIRLNFHIVKEFWICLIICSVLFFLKKKQFSFSHNYDKFYLLTSQDLLGIIKYITVDDNAHKDVREFESA